MKIPSAKILSGLVCAAVVAASASTAFAGNKSETVTLNYSVAVGSSKIDAGDCKISYAGDGPDVQVTFTEKGKTPITVPATLVKEKHSHAGVTTSTQDGGPKLLSVELNNVKLVVKDAPTTGQ